MSYSESFTPLSPSTTLFGSQILEPQRGKQVEAGVKYEPAGSPYAFNVAAYALREKNLAIDTGLGLEQAGSTRTSGVEAEFKGRLNRALDVVANYTYTKVDDEIEDLPAHQLSLWGRYRFAIGGVNGFSAGAGVRYASAFTDGAAPTVPSVTLLDLMFAYETSHWRYALNVSNATDKSYASTCLRRGDCWFGARRNIVASATYLF